MPSEKSRCSISGRGPGQGAQEAASRSFSLIRSEIRSAELQQTVSSGLLVQAGRDRFLQVPDGYMELAAREVKGSMVIKIEACVAIVLARPSECGALPRQDDRSAGIRGSLP